jgi:predicted secreted protein
MVIGQQKFIVLPISLRGQREAKGKDIGRSFVFCAPEI